MAYNAAANLRQIRPGQAFLQERDNVLRNALAERDMQLAEGGQQFNQQNALIQRERQQRMDEAAAQQQQQASEQEESKQLYTYLSHLDRLKANPQQFAATAQKMVASPLFQKRGITLEDLTPEEITNNLPAFAAEAGVGPAEESVQFEQVQGPRGAVLQRDPRTGELKQVVGPDNSQTSPAASGRARVLTAQEVAEFGFPAGTVAQELPDGRLDVVNKREGLSAAEQKAVRDAKMRMPRLDAAIRRVDRVGNAAKALSDNWFFDGGPADAKALTVTKEGRELMAAVATLMPELQALTRVPGIGSQSDLEARLAALALPSLDMNPETNARTMEELKAFVADLKSAYESIVAEGGGQSPTGGLPDGPTATGPNGQKIVLRGGQWVPL